MNKLIPYCLATLFFLPFISIYLGWNRIESLQLVINLIPSVLITFWLIWFHNYVERKIIDQKNKAIAIIVVVALIARVAAEILPYAGVVNLPILKEVNMLSLIAYGLFFIALIYTYKPATLLFPERTKWFIVIELLLPILMIFNWTQEIIEDNFVEPRISNDDLLDDIQ